MSLADEIAKLDDLRKSGALSEEEFREAKNALLGNVSGTRSATPTSPKPSAAPVTPAAPGQVSGVSANTKAWLAALAILALLAGGFFLYTQNRSGCRDWHHQVDTQAQQEFENDQLDGDTVGILTGERTLSFWRSRIEWERRESRPPGCPARYPGYP